MSSDVVVARGSNAQQALKSFWPGVMEEIRNLTVDYFREQQELPLIRIKKIMKMDEEVRMVSAEVPMMFAKAAQIFITELTLRAWVHTEENRRRTMQRSDVATAITKFDQFDFLIDIVPQYELKRPRQQEEARQSAEPPPYFFSPVHHGQHQGQQVNTQSAATIQAGQVIMAQQVQVQSQGAPITNAPVAMPAGEGQQVSNIQMAQRQTRMAQAQGQTMQGLQHTLANTGEIHQMPLNMGQLQYFRQAQPVPGTQLGQGQMQALAGTQQITQTEQQGQHWQTGGYWPSSGSNSSMTDSSRIRSSR